MACETFANVPKKKHREFSNVHMRMGPVTCALPCDIKREREGAKRGDWRVVERFGPIVRLV